MFVNIPFTPVEPGTKTYALTTMGYHLGTLFLHIFIHESQNDFREMLLHHLCTVLLYALMIYSNMLGIGCLIIFLHDIADIFTPMTKGFSQTPFNTATVITYFLCVCSWFYTRNLVFDYWVWRTVFLAR